MNLIQKIRDFFLSENSPDPELLGRFRSLADKEYEVYKETVLSFDAADVFELSEEICFYNAVREYILYGGYISNEVLNGIMTDQPIALMHAYAKMSHESTCPTWDEIQKIMELTFLDSEEVLYAS